MGAINGLDCQSCGACCVGTVDYGHHCDLLPEDLEKLSEWYQRKHVLNKRGDNYAHLAAKEHPDGFACVAFRGRVGGPCRCAIYDVRPIICQDFEPGTRRCLSCREEAGIDE